jgi:hypothetical protein
MTNVIQSSIQVNYLSSNVLRMQIPAFNQSQALTSNIRVQGVQNIGTTYEAIDLGTVATDAGPAYFFNRSTVNYVEIGREIAAAFEPFLRLPPNTGCFLPGVSDKDLFARANVAAIDLEYFICEP